MFTSAFVHTNIGLYVRKSLKFIGHLLTTSVIGEINPIQSLYRSLDTTIPVGPTWIIPVQCVCG